MKVTPRFIVRAGLVLSAAGAIGGFGACKDKGPVDVVPPTSPPPPAAPAAPTGVTATASGNAAINVAWTDASTNEDGFKIESCSGAGCTNFAEVGSVAANVATFAHSGLTASTEYSYRVMSFNAVGSSAASATAKATTGGVIVPPKSGVLIGAGEITSCATVQSNATAALVEAELAKTPDAIVFTVGNNVADSSAGTFANCFDPRWGRFKEHIRPAIGLRDYDKGPNAVFEYFGNKAGDAGKGWYSYDVGTDWHVIVLNTSTWQWGQAMLAPGSEQFQFLADDLFKSAGKKCTVAIFNWRRFYSYGTMENAATKEIWKALHAGGVDVILSAYDNYYERWAPQNHDMVRDDANGIRQFIVGTGGRTLSNYATLKPIDQVPNLEVRNNTTWGVLKLTLNASSYDWEFIPTTEGGFTDKGTANCH
jgi:hypothetical protein